MKLNKMKTNVMSMVLGAMVLAPFSANAMITADEIEDRHIVPGISVTDTGLSAGKVGVIGYGPTITVSALSITDLNGLGGGR